MTISYFLYPMIQSSIRKSFLEKFNLELKFFQIFLKIQTNPLWIGLIVSPASENVTTQLTLMFPERKKNPSINKKDFPVPVSGFSHRKKRAPLFSLVSLTTLLSLLEKKFLLLFVFCAADFSISMQIFVQCHVLPKRSQL